jgi:hypothetical protein
MLRRNGNECASQPIERCDPVLITLPFLHTPEKFNFACVRDTILSDQPVPSNLA